MSGIEKSGGSSFFSSFFRRSGEKSQPKPINVSDTIAQSDLMETLVKHYHLTHDESQFLIQNWGTFASEGKLTVHQFKSQSERFRRNLNLIVDCDYFLERIYNLIDANHDGSVSRAEFFNSFQLLFKGDAQYYNDLTFQIYAQENSAGVTVADLKRVIRGLWQTGLRTIMLEQNYDSFDMEEQVGELMDAAEIHHAGLAATMFDSIRQMQPIDPEVVPSPTLISKSAFNVWAVTDPTLTVFLNDYRKELHFIIRKKTFED